MDEARKPIPEPGGRIGRWLVLEETVTTEKGEKKRLCRCDCGTERYVLERSLRHGGSESCGCLRKERAAQAVSEDLIGRVFGELTVVSPGEPEATAAGRRWLCRCSCGKTCTVLATLLAKGRKTHCGGPAHKKNYAYADITGQRFEMLTALHPSENRKSSRSVTWRCRCDCGNEIDVSYNNLVYGNMKSCGCRKKAHDRQLKDLQIRVDGTSVNMIRSKKVPTDNTSGCRGVYFVRGRYMAKLVFQKKAYYLGTYDRFEEAVQARQEAEELVFDGAAAFYEKWRARADRDPGWAAENPIRITVSKGSDGALHMLCQPREVDI